MDKLDNKKIREYVFNKFNGRCAYCGCIIEMSNFTIDHIIPLRRNDDDIFLKEYNLKRGKNKIENYNPCCKSCNSSKSSFTIDDWRNEIALKYERLIRDSSQFRLLLRFNMIKYNPEVKFYFEKQWKVG